MNDYHKVQFVRTDTEPAIRSGFGMWTLPEIDGIMKWHQLAGRVVRVEYESPFSSEWPEFTDDLDFFDAYDEVEI